MDYRRRVILQRSLVAGSAVVSLMSTGKLWARWPATAFDQSTLADALSDISNGVTATESDLVMIEVPELVENAAIVPVRVSTDLPDVTSISLFVEDNRSPLAGTFHLDKNVRARISTRLRLEQSGRVVAAVKSEGAYYINGTMVDLKAFACQPVKPTDKATQ